MGLDLNAHFTKKIGELPAPAEGIIEIPSDRSIAAAANTLIAARILSAPVKDVNADPDARWGEKYLGMVATADIVERVLQAVGEIDTEEGYEDVLERSEILQNTPVEEVTRGARFGPLMPLEPTSTLLDAMLMMANYNIHRIPIVDFEKSGIVNLITQSSVVGEIKKLGEAGTIDLSPSLETVGLATPKEIVSVLDTEPLSSALNKLITETISGLAVLDQSGMLVGNFSSSDALHLVTHPLAFTRTARGTLTAAGFLDWKRKNGLDRCQGKVITCVPSDSISHVISVFAEHKIHRVYMVNGDKPIRVVTLGDIMGALVTEPPNHFGDFFVHNTPEFRS